MAINLGAGATFTGPIAAEGILRKEFCESLGVNAKHGSDATDTVAFEIGCFFSGLNYYSISNGLY